MLLFRFDIMRNCRLKLQVQTCQNGWKNRALVLFTGVNGSQLPLVPAVVNCRRLLEWLLTAVRGY